MKLKPLFPLSRYQFSHCHSLAGQKARQNTKLPCKFRTWPATEVNETRYAKVKETLNEVKVHQVNTIKKTVHLVKVNIHWMKLLENLLHIRDEAPIFTLLLKSCAHSSGKYKDENLHPFFYKLFLLNILLKKKSNKKVFLFP